MSHPLPRFTEAEDSETWTIAIEYGITLDREREVCYPTARVAYMERQNDDDTTTRMEPSP